MRLFLLGCLVVLGASIGGCEDIEQCAPPGETQACTCTDGRSGAQECLPEGVWDGCVCTGPFGDASANSDPLGGDGDATGDGDGDTTTGVPASGDGEGDAAGDGDGDAAGDGDGDASGDGDGDVSGDGDGDTGDGDGDGDGDVSGDGDGDVGGDGDGDVSGDGDGDSTPVNAYADCSMDGDCPVDGSTCVPNVPAPFTTSNVCSPPCMEADDCQVPDGSYEATIECNLGRCMLNCTSVNLLTPRTCPTGLECLSTGFSSTCFAE